MQDTNIRRVDRSLRRPHARIEQIYAYPIGGIMVDGCRLLFSILIPPLGVFFKVGLGGQFWLNIFLTILGYVPGLIHAIWVIFFRK